MGTKVEDLELFFRGGHETVLKHAPPERRLFYGNILLCSHFFFFVKTNIFLEKIGEICKDICSYEINKIQNMPRHNGINLFIITSNIYATKMINTISKMMNVIVKIMNRNTIIKNETAKMMNAITIMVNADARIRKAIVNIMNEISKTMNRLQNDECN